MTEPLITSNATMLLAAFSLFPLAAGILWIHQRLTARKPRSQATRGLSHAERQRRLSALHLDTERRKAIEAMGRDWVLHPEYRGRAK